MNAETKTALVLRATAAVSDAEQLVRRRGRETEVLRLCSRVFEDAAKLADDVPETARSLRKRALLAALDPRINGR